MSVKIVFHCSDSTFGNAALIARWHSLPKPDGRGWSGIGYHYVILNGWLSSTLYNEKFDGYIETGRPLNGDLFITSSEMGAHVRGHNKDSIGICLIGKSGKFSENQLNESLILTYQLEKQFNSIILGQHSDFDKNKSFCAGLNMERFKANYELFKQLRV